MIALTLTHAFMGIGLVAAAIVAIALVCGLWYMACLWWDEAAPDWFVTLGSALAYIIAYSVLLGGSGLFIAYLIWGKKPL